MTDRQLTAALASTLALETRARAAWAAANTRHVAREAEAAIATVRLVVPLIRSLEHWIQGRAAALEAAEPAAGG